jgi:hypothetical protein
MLAYTYDITGHQVMDTNPPGKRYVAR